MNNTNSIELVSIESAQADALNETTNEVDFDGSVSKMVSDLLDLELAPLGKSFTTMCSW